MDLPETENISFYQYERKRNVDDIRYISHIIMSLEIAGKGLIGNVLITFYTFPPFRGNTKLKLNSIGFYIHVIATFSCQSHHEYDDYNFSFFFFFFFN